MTEIIVVLIVFSLMGSALWVLPSKKERAKMDMRMRARKHGLQVQLTQLSYPDKWDKVTEKRPACAYHLFRGKPLKDFTDIRVFPYEVWKYAPLGSWYSSRAVGMPNEIVDLLDKYHHVLLAVEIKSDCISLFWNEQGDLDVVDELASVLHGVVEVR